LTANATWLLLRGLTRESRHWGAFPELLQRSLDATTVLAPDLPGNGRLCHLASPTCVEGMVASYRDQLREMGVPPPYRLVALSMGGMIGIDWAQRHPGEIGAMVLINTSLRGINPIHARLRPCSYVDLLRLTGADAEQRERIILARTSNRHGNEHALVEAWAGYRHQCPVSWRNALRQMFAAARYRAPASPPPVPTLLLAAAADRLVDAKCSRQIAKRWNVPLSVHSDAGHDLPLDDPDWVVMQIGDWLRQANL
jgi:pimeloyl-ACP methyl ester carboxylesterase